MEFESTIARRVSNREHRYKGWMVIVGAVLAVFLVLNVTSGSLGAQNAVIQIGSKNSVARYLGQFDGRSNVLMAGASSADDWICVKIPFKGRLSDIKAIAFSEFVAQTGGQTALEPYIVVRLTEGRNLICNPTTSYSNTTWDLPFQEWQLRDVVSKGMWVYSSADTKSSAAPLTTWIRTIGNANVLSVNLYVGRWYILSPYQCYIGDLAVNWRFVDLSNAGRYSGSLADLPSGF